MCSAEELGVEVDSISNLEVQCQRTSGVHRDLVVMLCCGDLSPEFLVEFVEVYSKFSCTCRGKVSFGVYGGVQVIALLVKNGETPVVVLGVLL